MIRPSRAVCASLGTLSSCIVPADAAGCSLNCCTIIPPTVPSHRVSPAACHGSACPATASTACSPRTLSLRRSGGSSTAVTVPQESSSLSRRLRPRPRPPVCAVTMRLPVGPFVLAWLRPPVLQGVRRLSRARVTMGRWSHISPYPGKCASSSRDAS